MKYTCGCDAVLEYLDLTTQLHSSGRGTLP